MFTTPRMKAKAVITAFIYFWTMANVKGAKDPEFTNMWIAEIHGGEEVAQRVARDLGYTYKGQADKFENHYVLTRDDHPEVSTRSSHHMTQALQDVDEVKWAQQQYSLLRSKRGNVPKEEQPSKELKASHFGGGSNGPGFVVMSPEELEANKAGEAQGETSKLGTFSTKPSAGEGSLATYQGVTKNIQLLSKKESAYTLQFNDPMWPKQWYDQDYRTEDLPVMDHNVVPVYKMGITGKGITVAVVDDGLQNGHPDLQENYNISLSWDVCNDKPGSEPDPPEPKADHSHGTKCAGMVAMVANNDNCGVGVAYEATVAGIKVLGRRTVAYVESRGLMYNLDDMDIYTCSWGPEDDGIRMEDVEHLSNLALKIGVTKGRNGKGAIYTFAAGNGRHVGDNCGGDGYMNHIDTIAVSAVGQNGKVSYYSERCSAVYTAAYSGTDDWLEKTVATGLNGECNLQFSGTSSATPLIAGIIALTLQENSNLTYRDVMHLITMSAEVAPVADNGDTWYKNGRGFWVSNDFGFGLLNAENMVNLAKSWKNVPKKNTCIISVKLATPENFTVGEDARMGFNTLVCQDSKDEVNWLEQVEVASTISYPYRGAISITLFSPAGTKTALLETRRNDNTTSGLNGWSLKSVHNWGEDPKGTWYIYVAANPLTEVEPGVGYVYEFAVTFHGTRTRPSHYKHLPRKYAPFRLSNGKTSED